MTSHTPQQRWRQFEDAVATVNTSSIGDQVCAHFGCGIHLTMHAALFGKYCVHHQVRVPIDPTKVIKFK